ncbi:hypothetical protein BZB76_2618 [Actinomadura pelletieri DSM 43383]|uniref:Uncharacterized protein n=1 Tax=Actinomadura pelletieri DSM 43383 TaxID=1120940 RepID=A0A495QUS2_9ACTN|nr:hypothetical protein [Actinomadura pelletieri]RKS77240.1 hypothetical protein BZB76_2618 [Actinomadura pelletieri DSM 43383]
MADRTAAGDRHLVVPSTPNRPDLAGCPVLKIMVWVLAALVGVAAAGALVSLLPRGRGRRGTRRIPRRRPWQRARSAVPAPRTRQDTGRTAEVEDDLEARAPQRART